MSLLRKKRTAYGFPTDEKAAKTYLVPFYCYLFVLTRFRPLNIHGSMGPIGWVDEYQSPHRCLSHLLTLYGIPTKALEQRSRNAER